MSIWKGKAPVFETPWGHEHRWGSPWGVQGKLICLDAEKRTSLKYYKSKDEVLYCFKGRVTVHAPDENEFGQKNLQGKGSWFELLPGEMIFIQRENSYRISALEDSILIEVTSGGMHGEDCIRLEDDFNRVKKRRE